MTTPTRPLAVPAVPEISEPLAVIRSLLAASKGAGAADVMRHFQGALDGKLEQVRLAPERAILVRAQAHTPSAVSYPPHLHVCSSCGNVH